MRLSCLIVLPAVLGAVSIGDYVPCNQPRVVTETPFGAGIMVYRSGLVSELACPSTGHAVVDTPLLFNTKLKYGKVVERTVCTLSMEAMDWYPLLKVSTTADTSLSALSQEALGRYAGEVGPVVLVFPTGDVFIPAAALQAATSTCATSTPSTHEPLTAGSPTYMLWGVRAWSDLKFPRIISVGDLHGDQAQARKVLYYARLVDKQGKWIGGCSIFVQTGDQIDRGTDTQTIMEWLEGLKTEATSTGGQVILLNGNHEYMNMAGDERFVPVQDKSSMKARRALFTLSPPGPLAKLIMSRPCVALVHGTIFAHAGITTEFAKLGIQGINKAVQEGLTAYVHHKDLPVFGDDGPFWFRGYASGSPEYAQQLKQVLTMLKAKRMVVGHTIQQDYLVHTLYNKQLVLQDVAISGVYGGGHVGFVEMRGTGLWALSPAGWRQLDTNPT